MVRTGTSAPPQSNTERPVGSAHAKREASFQAFFSILLRTSSGDFAAEVAVVDSAGGLRVTVKGPHAEPLVLAISNTGDEPHADLRFEGDDEPLWQAP
jgi:hypothetical protein